MTKQIEVEFIGSISEQRFNDLKSFFNENGGFKKKKKRLSLMYFRGFIPKHLEEIKDEAIDLRLRITNKEPEIVLKHGLFNAMHARKEISLPIDKDKIHDYIEFLKLLGWHLSVVYATETFVFEFKGIEFSLIDIQDYGFNFEAEILANEDEIKEAKDKIISVLNMLDLKPFDEKELAEQSNAINNNKDLQFDFNKHSFDKIKEKFSSFF